MKRLIVTLMLLAASAPLGAQWLRYPTPGLPRTPDGKPNLTVPAPRTADGKPDLSGLWRLNGLGYSFNIFGAQKVEMLPWAEAVFAERSARYGKDGPSAHCLPPGPRAGLFGQEPVKFVQTPGLLLVLYEDAPTRQIFMDGRELPKDPNPAWMGYSVARWEGDTFVVESSGFNDRTWLDLTGHPHTEALHFTERFHRLDYGHMQLEMTFNDPMTYRKPWTIAVDVELIPDTELLENVCNENEKDRGHLVGTVADEKQGEVTVSEAILFNYAGTYMAGPLGHIRITVDHGHLAFNLSGGGGQFLAFAKSEEDFILPALGGVALKFEKDAHGAVAFLRITSVEGDIRAPRLPDNAGGID